MIWYNYDKHDGSLIGFVNFGDTNNQILEFKVIMNTGESCASVAITMMVVMVSIGWITHICNLLVGICQVI